tara:strand:- start:431 stop:715 length:285 start_codon:yes stop_codon:yes gene_type:complete
MNEANISDINSELNQLGIKYQKRFPKSNFLGHFFMLNAGHWMGLHLSTSEIKQILKKCLKENKIFQVWDYKWKSEQDMPCDWHKCKLVFKKYSE